MPDGLAAIKRGLLTASVFQDPKAQATQAVQAAVRMIKGEAIESEVWVPFELIKPEQVAVFEQRYK